MPIVKCHANKRALSDTVSYIMNPLKTISRGNQGFMTADPNEMVNQMQETLRLHGKQKGRQYYHVKVAFSLEDRPENGGSLTAEKANAYAAKYAAYLWQGNEVIWACQDHGSSIHVHFIVSACQQETGKKLNVDNREYCKWKDHAQELATELNLTPLDWREAVRQKKMRDRMTGSPVYESFAEKGRHAKGKGTYKDQLRRIIDQALIKAKNMEEFRAELEKQDVVLTRCTSATISYKWGDRRAYRGDTLGDDFTAIAVANRLMYNQRQTGVDSKIKTAALRSKGKKSPTQKELDTMYDFGRMIGLCRGEIDQLVEYALFAGKEGKVRVWEVWKENKSRFWKNYQESQKEISDQLDELYRKRKLLKQAEWLIHPYNTKKSLWGVLFAMILRLSTHTGLTEIEAEIAYYKAARDRLRWSISEFKTASEKGIQNINNSDFQLDGFLDTISRMHASADLAFCAALDIPLERQFVLTDRGMVSKADLLKQQENLITERR